jgi:hypothetical protein
MSMLPADTHRRLRSQPRLVASYDALLAAMLPVRDWEFNPGPDPERCTCAGADSLCEGCLAMRGLFEDWATEQRLLDAEAWAAYSRAWPAAMSGVRAMYQWEQALLPDLLAASEAAEPSGEEP